MKKFILAIIVAIVGTTSYGQTTVVVQNNGFFSDVASALTLPLYAVGGFVVGTVEAVGGIFTGSTQVNVVTEVPPVPAPYAYPVVPAPVPPPVVAPAPAAGQVVVTSPIVYNVPRTTVTTTTSSPIKVPGGKFVPDPVTQITTVNPDGSTTTVIRPAGGFELGPNVVRPVDPAHRPGHGALANPYVYRYK